MKRALKIFLSCALVLFAVGGILFLTRPKTLDFRGSVTEIKLDGEDTVFCVSLGYAAYTVRANERTRVSYCCEEDPEISLADIRIGDTVEGNYRAFSKNHSARFITVEYHN